MIYTVRILNKAQQDVAVILTWLEKRSAKGAATWFNRFVAACDALRTDAARWALAPESVEFEFPVQQFMFKTPRGRNYRILYTIVGDEVRVLHVRGPGQDLVMPK